MQLQNVHLTEEDFKAFEQGGMGISDREHFLQHTAGCPRCGDFWFAYLSRHEDALAVPPAYLEQEIAERVREPDVVIARQVHRTSKKIRLLLYSLKVGVALAASIYMLFAMDMSAFQTLLHW